VKFCVSAYGVPLRLTRLPGLLLLSRFLILPRQIHTALSCLADHLNPAVEAEVFEFDWLPS
jgi:hypothetical protein